MNTRRNLLTVTQLTRDTFRQASASGVFWIMVTITAICVLVCLSVNVSGDVVLHGGDEPLTFVPPTSPRTMAASVVVVLGSARPLDVVTRTAAAGLRVWLAKETNPALAREQGVETIRGTMTVAFGAIPIPMGRERADAVRFLELLLAGGAAGTLGLLLALIWTAGFVPTFLEPSSAAVLLAKPVARWQLLLGKFLGVLAFVAFQVVLFVALTWLALGLRTRVWDMTYWYCIPLLLLQFAIFYSFSVLLAVLTRSTVACAFGSLMFWCLAWAINYGSVMAVGLQESQALPTFTQRLAQAAYWISPKPIDVGLILFNTMDMGNHFEKPADFRLLESRGFSPTLSILSSLVITVALLALAAHELNAKDY